MGRRGGLEGIGEYSWIISRLRGVQLRFGIMSGMRRVAYVHSRYKRVEGDNYQTVDKRCVDSFLEWFVPEGVCIDVCSPEGSGIVDRLVERGYEARGVRDAFVKHLQCSWVITNPPYKRPLVDKIIERQVERLESKEVEGVAVLLRANFDLARCRTWLFGNPLYYGQVRMRFRPWWTGERDKQPIHNFVWQIWRRREFLYPIVMYAG